MGMTARGATVRRLGMFGGAFDPPHNAHVALARAAVEQLHLDELRIFPTGQAWHKSRELSAKQHRLAMAQQAFAGVPNAVVDGRELQRSGFTYTIDTLRELRQEFPQAELLLVIGADQAEALHTWRENAEIAQIATISIAARARPTGATGTFDASRLPPGRRESVELPPMPFSSTEIRARAAAGQGIDHLVPAAVARYIEHHHLYQSA
ncbi:MAG: nicotinate-nucleotide adenylyltransferase [Ramlibacter sp.]|nr:nicotinate-nucleotide adenylyltransferase [Ramlibacter sp.]MCW5650841.1 nicotinate-nucleotide adenylyltransferase [Ramlibacter sp.]